MNTATRRGFLQTSLMGATALTAAGAAEKPGEKITLAILGVKNRGKDLLRGFAAFPDVEIAYVCDPDLNVVPAALKALPERHRRVPAVVQDMRQAFKDKAVDAVVVATPDHWHALATIWACQAGKHVYVEKPLSHNLVEGQRMVEAARKYRRVVQVGTQRRSAEHLKEAADFVRAGKLGKIPFARAWIAGHRPSIGKKADTKAPDKVDYNLWLGAAPERPFNPNRFHYNWHWTWDYGTGEVGNNGIHGLDMIRMLMGVDAPKRISSGGGMFFYDDDREAPDTQQISFDFDGCSVVWEHRMWARTGVRDQAFGVELVGEKGTLVVDGKGWHVEQGAEKGDKVNVKTTPFEAPHLRNFLDCIRSGKKPAADVEIGHHSTRLCHLGNIAYRLGRTLRFDPTTQTIPNDAEANKLLTRTYRKGFALPERV